MLKVSRIIADRIPRKTIIAAGQDPHTALFQRLHIGNRDVQFTPQAQAFGHLGGDAPVGRFI